MKKLFTLLSLLVMGIGGALAQHGTATWKASSTVPSQGAELSSNTAIVSVTTGNGTWAYNSGRGGIYVATQTIGYDTDTKCPNSGDYIVIKPVVDINFTMSVYASQSNCNVNIVEADAPSTVIKTFRTKGAQTEDWGTLSAGKTYYIYGASYKTATTDATSLEYVFYKNFTAKSVESYSIKYTDNSATPITIKDDIIGTGLYGDKVTASSDQMANIVYGGNTYVYDSGNAEITLGTTNTITLVYKQAPVYNYTIKYVDEDNNSIADDVTGANIEGYVLTASAEQMADITKDGQKYIYKEGNEELALSTTEEDNVITLVYRKAATYAYALRAMNGETVIKTIKEGTVVEGETATEYFPKGFILDNKVYTTSETTFNKNITVAGNVDIAYTESDLTYFFEQTDLTWSHSSAAQQTKDFGSNGTGDRFYKQSYAYTPALAGGIYTVEIAGWIYTKTPTVDYGYRLNGVNYALGTTESFNNGSYAASKTVENIVIPEGASFVLLNSTEWNSNLFIDYVTLKKTAELSAISYAKDLSKTGYASFSAPVAVTVPTGTSAYKASISGTTVTLTKVEGVIPANTGVILYNSAKEDAVSLTGTTEESTADFTDNKLIPTSVAANQTVPSEGTYYALSASAAEFGVLTAGIILGANKAYIEASSGSAKLSLIFADDETTGINEVNANVASAKVAYNLAGQRVSANTKGIVIMNGKKMMNK